MRRTGRSSNSFSTIRCATYFRRLNLGWYNLRSCVALMGTYVASYLGWGHTLQITQNRSLYPAFVQAGVLGERFLRYFRVEFLCANLNGKSVDPQVSKSAKGPGRKSAPSSAVRRTHKAASRYPQFERIEDNARYKRCRGEGCVTAP